MSIIVFSTLCLLLVCTPLEAQSPAATKEVVLKPDQTLEDLAQQLYEDPKAADELRALNKLAHGAQPKPGQKLTLPGNDRQPAISAVGVARRSVHKAEEEGSAKYAPERLKQVRQSLKLAEETCYKADYSKCQTMADETWALARLAIKECRARRPKKNRFAVSVSQEGATRVEVLEGDGVKVTAQKKSTTVKRGHAVDIKSGKSPGKARPLLAPPKQILPFANSVLVTTSIQFHWEPVAGATRYVLLISRDAHGYKPVRQLTTEQTSYLFRSSLPDGDYYWFLRTADPHGAVGRASEARKFSLKSKETGVSIEETKPAGSQKGP